MRYTGWANFDCRTGRKVSWGRIPRTTEHFGIDSLLALPRIRIQFCHRADGREDVVLLLDAEAVETVTCSRNEAQSLWKECRKALLPLA